MCGFLGFLLNAGRFGLMRGFGGGWTIEGKFLFAG